MPDAKTHSRIQILLNPQVGVDARREAADWLAQEGGRSAAPFLIQAAANPEVVSGRTLGSVGKPALDLIVRNARAKKWKLRKHACEALYEYPKKQRAAAAKQAVPTLVRLLRDTNFAVRFDATCALREWGALADAAVPAIERSWTDVEPMASNQMAALVGIGTPRAIAALRRASKGDGRRALDAQHALVERRMKKLRTGRLWVEEVDAILSVGTGLSRIPSELAPEFAWARRQIRRQRTLTLPRILIKLRKSSSTLQREIGVRALGILGNAGLPHLHQLIDALNDREETVKIAATWALAMLPPSTVKAAVPCLVELLNDRSYNVRAAAQSALRTLRPKNSYESPAGCT